MCRFTVIKRDAAGQDELSYPGTLRERGEGFVCIDAVFDFADRDLGYIQLKRGDRFREWFYADRWFNIFRVSDGASNELKGWYCNITRPPRIGASSVAADDLCLDIFVDPDGRTLLLDEDEFSQLQLTDHERRRAAAAVATLKRMVAGRRPPFDEIRTKPEREIPARDRSIPGPGESPARAH